MPIFCSKTSKIKMVILLKNGNDHLKTNAANGNLFNPVWYSIISKDKYPTQIIIQKMQNRFLKSNFINVAHGIIFYDNQTKNELVRFCI